MAASVFASAAAEGPRQSKLHDLQPVSEVREEELALLLTSLVDRCQTMLDLQIAVHEGTKSLHKIIESEAGKKLRAEDRQAALKLAENQKAIVAEATTTINMLLAQGAAVAFPEVFEQVAKDMKEVQRRLNRGDAGREMQALQEDVIETLRDMLKGFRKRCRGC